MIRSSSSYLLEEEIIIGGEEERSPGHSHPAPARTLPQWMEAGMEAMGGTPHPEHTPAESIDGYNVGLVGKLYPYFRCRTCGRWRV
jgi:hypothetical protein